MRKARDAMFKGKRDVGRQSFQEAASWLKKSINLQPTTEYAGDNLRAVLVALDANFNIPASDEEKQLLEDVGAPYDVRSLSAWNHSKWANIACDMMRQTS